MPLAEFAEGTASARLVVLVGAEASGLIGDRADAADVHVRIPISSEVDSLNVVVAAGIALASLSRL